MTQMTPWHPKTTGVLHLRSQYFVDGGAETFLNALLSHLPADRFRHHVALLPRGDIDRPAFCEPLLGRPDCTVACTKIPWRRADLGRIVARVTEIVHAGDYRVLHSHDLRASVVAALVRRRLGRSCRWIASAHGWFTTPLKVRLHGEVEKLVVRLADRIHFASERLYRWLPLPPRRKLVAIPYFLDPARFREDYEPQRLRDLWGVPAGVPLLGFVARMTPEKGHLCLLRALARVAERHPDFRAVLVGKGPMRSRLEALTRSLGLEDHVSFVGYVEDALEACSAFDLLVHPSLGETMAPALMEAIHLGKPVVATDVGAHRELVRQGENGLLVPPGDHRALADAILQMLDDPDRLARAAHCSRSIRRDFLPESVAPRYGALYEELAREAREPTSESAPAEHRAAPTRDA